MADPQVIQCADACTVTVVHELLIPGITSLSIEEAAAISGAVLLVWAVGFVFRILAQFLFSRQPTNETE